MKTLIVLTSHSELGNTGNKTGFKIEEFAAPYSLKEAFYFNIKKIQLKQIL